MRGYSSNVIVPAVAVAALLLLAQATLVLLLPLLRSQHDAATRGS